MDEVGLPTQTEKRYVVDGVPVTPNVSASSTDSTDFEAVSGEGNSMTFNLQTSGLALQIQTKTSPNTIIVELQSRLEFALLKLSESELRLDAAMRRIGFLEAHLETKSAEVCDLRAKVLALQSS